MLICCFKTMSARRKRFAANDSGQVLLMMAILALGLLAVVASVIPVGQAVTGKIQAQNAADAAAMAAATWMARGSNLLQMTNGIHWDVDALIAIAMTTSAEAAIAAMAAALAEWDFPAAIKLFKNERKFLDEMLSVHKTTNNVISKFQDFVAKATPLIAFFHADSVAYKNGASHLDLTEFPLIKNIPGINTLKLKDGLAEDLKKFIPHIWTLSPSLNPLKALKIAKAVNAKNPSDAPFKTNEINPFLFCKLFFPKGPLKWDDKYFETDETTLDKPVTVIVSRHSEKSFILNDLLEGKSGKGLIPAIYAFASSKYTGDKLYPSGLKDMRYICLPGFVFAWPPPGWRAIGSLLGTGGSKSEYRGYFKSQLVPVAFNGGKLPGKKLMILH
jgi:hypothetical protein